MKRATIIGLISDTHGLVRPEVFEALQGVSQILHAGDVGPADVLTELATIAPVRAVFGNTDAPGRPDLVERIDDVIDGVRIVVTHGHELGSPTPPKLVGAYPTADVIVYGHTHQQLVTKAARRVVVNPGAAGPRRFKLQPCVAKLYIYEGQADVELIPLGIPGDAE
ncbi:metallophosphoesterase family protein [Gemmatimonas sp.]|jgi:putative phosphoesterase|uniref:metallophosphoesterase family protein n=1 Tax=Gemmatimonas sp. TaxID=1962908 RepID=UPI0022BC12C3|nr:metallophosphoesterase family protein [Gemmatimonas sp.]MCZ8203281.1 metallophosphoesterase family protein [Gemmatimonas sp.]